MPIDLESLRKSLSVVELDAEINRLDGDLRLLKKALRKAAGGPSGKRGGKRADVPSVTHYEPSPSPHVPTDRDEIGQQIVAFLQASGPQDREDIKAQFAHIDGRRIRFILDELLAKTVIRQSVKTMKFSAA